MTRAEWERYLWRYTARDLRVERKDGTRLVVRRTTERVELTPLASLTDSELFSLLPDVVQAASGAAFAEYLAGKQSQRTA